MGLGYLIKLILRNRVLGILLMAGLIVPSVLVLVGWNLIFPSHKTMLDLQLVFYQTSRILVLANIIFSLELAGQIEKYKMAETIRGIRRGYLKLFENVIILWVIIAMMQFLFYSGYQLLMGWSQFIHLSKIMTYFLKSNLLFYFLLPLLALLLGTVLSTIRQKLIAYIIIIGFFILTLAENITALANLPFLRENFASGLPDLLLIFPQWGLLSYVYGFPAESVILYRLVFWICLLVLILFYLVGRDLPKVSRIASLTLLSVVSIGSLFMTQRPSSVVNFSIGTSLKSMSHDQVYYVDYEYLEEPAEFSIAKYEIDLDIKHQLFAKATVHYQSKSEAAPQMSFTLYHGYKVKKITGSDGKSLSFRQAGDYIDVLDAVPPSGSLTFYYEGFGMRFYSNEQGVYLPGFYPYYPHAGKYQVYDISGFTMVPDQVPQTNFHLSITGEEDIITNLTKTAPGVYEGIAESVSILSGLYDQTMVGSVILDKPALEIYSYADTLKSTLSESEILVTGDPLTRVSIMPSVNNIGVFELIHITSGHLFSTTLETYDTYKDAYLVSPRKMSVYMLWEDFENYLEFYERWRHVDLDALAEDPVMMEQLGEEPASLVGMENKPQYIMAKALNKMTVEEIKAYMEEYIYDTTDDRSVEQFYLDLKDLTND